MTIETCPLVESGTQKPTYCAEARRLLDAFGEAVQLLILLHEQQFVAILNGDNDAGRFDMLVFEAIERKQNAKYAFIHHQEAHGCS